MPFTIIKGTFHVKGYSPDGDSVRFKANNKANWNKLSGPPAKLNGQDHAQLRFEAIDTLETHYERFHQPIAFAEAALTFLLTELGITNVQWDANHQNILQANDGTQGFILSREVEQNRRPVAFVFAGGINKADGSSFHLTPQFLKKSANYKSLAAGHAYATYYKGLFPDLRVAMTTAVRRAQNQNPPLGIWSEDKTTSGFPVQSIDQVMNNVVILPKLFRRVIKHIEGGGTIANFKAALALDPDPVLLLPTGHFTNLDTVVDVDQARGTIKLTLPPEEMVFIPKP